MKKLAVMLVSILSTVVLFGCDAETPTKEDTQEQDTNTTETVTIDQKAAPADGDKIGIIKTNMGVIKFALFPEATPETAKNFEELANAGKYDNIIFHRIIFDFMVQGGDFENQNGTGGHSYQGPGTKIKDEFHKDLTHLYGAVSMANSGPNTNGSQFFIVQKKDGTDWLNGMHSVFGQVYQGMDVVEAIAGVETDARDKPLRDVVLEKALVTTVGSPEDQQY